MHLEHHLHVVGGYVRYISPHIIIIIINLGRGSKGIHHKGIQLLFVNIM